MKKWKEFHIQSRISLVIIIVLVVILIYPLLLYSPEKPEEEEIEKDVTIEAGDYYVKRLECNDGDTVNIYYEVIYMRFSDDGVIYFYDSWDYEDYKDGDSWDDGREIEEDGDHFTEEIDWSEDYYLIFEADGYNDDPMEISIRIVIEPTLYQFNATLIILNALTVLNILALALLSGYIAMKEFHPKSVPTTISPSLNQNQGRFCGECGAKTVFGDRFCRECGNEII